MFEFLARFACRRSRLVLGIWIVLIACVLPVLPHISGPLQVGGFSASDSEGARAVSILQEELGFSPSQLAVIFTSHTLTTDNPAFLQQIDDAVAPLRDFPYVDDVITPRLDQTLIAPSRRLAYAVVGLSEPAEKAQREAREIEDAIIPQPDLTVVVAGGPSFYSDVEFASQRDLQRAEVIAFPFALIALVVVFGSVVAAAVPLLVGSAGVAVALLSLYWLAHVVDMSIFVLNLTTMLGLGLAIDYSLFVTSRFREELDRNGGDVDAAVVTAMMTAGRAVFFSGMTVLVGLSGLTIFDIMFLRSVGIAGVIVVAVSALGALTLLPALLRVIGSRINSLSVGPLARQDREDEVHLGFWYRLARKVERRAVIVTVVTIAILALLGSPFLHANISSPDATMLPKDLPSRQGYDLLSSAFTGGEISPFVILIESGGDMRSPQSLQELDALDTFLRQDSRIGHIQSALTAPGISTSLSPEQRLQARERIERLGVDTRLDNLIGDHAAMILAYPVAPANSPQNKDLLAELRAWQPGVGYTVLVGGGTAEIVDVVHDIYSRFPLVAVVIIGATYLILLLLFRSVILPLKAILMNTMSILAAYGALVFIFQDGHLHRLLNFTPQGYVEASLPVIMFCVLFGLSMDYEVFLLSRVQEEWLRTGDNAEAVAVGLERSGRIITSAALIVVVVTASFVSADVVLVKALGLCIALAVAIDATIVRALLVPATMKLLGHWNWWLPSWLDRLLPSIDLDEA